MSLNLDYDGNGSGIIVVGGTGNDRRRGCRPARDKPYWDKYGAAAERSGLAEAMRGYSTRIKVSIDKVWTTPS